MYVSSYMYVYIDICIYVSLFLSLSLSLSIYITHVPKRGLAESEGVDEIKKARLV